MIIPLQEENGDRGDVPNVVILITDGISNERETETVAMAKRLKDSGTRIIAIGVTDAVDVTELKVMVTNEPGDLLLADDFDKLNSVMDSLVKVSCVTLPTSE